MSEHDGFLEAIRENPTDDAPRLIYAGTHLRALARSQQLPRLEDLDLRQSTAPAAAWWALIRSPHRTALRRLRLRGTREALTDHHPPTDLREHPELRPALEARFGTEGLDWESEFSTWKGQRWTERPLVSDTGY
jgi:hypothetical protein